MSQPSTLYSYNSNEHINSNIPGFRFEGVKDEHKPLLLGKLHINNKVYNVTLSGVNDKQMRDAAAQRAVIQELAFSIIATTFQGKSDVEEGTLFLKEEDKKQGLWQKDGLGEKKFPESEKEIIKDLQDAYTQETKKAIEQVHPLLGEQASLERVKIIDAMLAIDKIFKQTIQTNTPLAEKTEVPSAAETSTPNQASAKVEPTAESSRKKLPVPELGPDTKINPVTANLKIEVTQEEVDILERPRDFLSELGVALTLEDAESGTPINPLPAVDEKVKTLPVTSPQNNEQIPEEQIPEEQKVEESKVLSNVKDETDTTPAIPSEPRGQEAISKLGETVGPEELKVASDNVDQSSLSEEVAPLLSPLSFDVEEKKEKWFSVPGVNTIGTWGAAACLLYYQGLESSLWGVMGAGASLGLTYGADYLLSRSIDSMKTETASNEGWFSSTGKVVPVATRIIGSVGASLMAKNAVNFFRGH